MNKWIIHYEGAKALEEILKIGEVTYQPKIPVEYIVMTSHLDKDTIMKIEGVTNCRTPEIGKLSSDKHKEV